MDPFGKGDNPSRRQHQPLPNCLTRLLHPQRLDAGYLAQAAGPARSRSANRTYARVLASLWLDLDRLGQLTDLMVNPKKSV